MAELQVLDWRLRTLAGTLPEANGEFDEQAEVRSAIETVRADLLADAIETLSVAANSGSNELQRRYRQRKRWLAVEAV